MSSSITVVRATRTASPVGGFGLPGDALQIGLGLADHPLLGVLGGDLDAEAVSSSFQPPGISVHVPVPSIRLDKDPHNPG